MRKKKPIKIETRGRKKTAEKLTNFVDIEPYYRENFVSEEQIKQEKINNEKTIIEENKQKDINLGVDNNNSNNSIIDNLNIESNGAELVEIKLDKKNLMMFDIFLDSIAQKILNTVGFKIELQPMEDNDLEIWEKLAPPLKLTRSWENFFKFYVVAKVKN
jgi:hypothetical protein